MTKKVVRSVKKMEPDEIAFYILSVGDYSYYCEDLVALAAKYARYAPMGLELEMWACSPTRGRTAKREVIYAR